MKPPRIPALLPALAAGIALLVPSAVSAAVTIDWVLVGDAGNDAQSAANRAHSSSGGDGFGAVNYDYQIGKYLVTNNQYAPFLNAVAASDPYGLYNASMTSSTQGGITRGGSPGSYSCQADASRQAARTTPSVTWKFVS